MLCSGIACGPRRRGGRGGLGRHRLSGERHKAETQSAKAQSARGECKAAHGCFPKLLIDLELLRLAVDYRRSDEARMKLR